MLNWKDKQDGVDDVLSEDINDIAHAVIDLQNNTIDQTYKETSENAQSGKAVAEALKTVSVDLSNYYTKTEVDAQIGYIETALDNIILIQNSLIGGESV